jgi:hypothetical protein
VAGFIRRFGYFPGTEQITQIEGVVIVDLPPPGAVRGVSVGTVGVVGEFADMSFATSVDDSGNVTTNPQSVEIFSGADLIQKLGGFDETIGEFGGSLGNGFVALRNKRFSRLVCVPVNLASAKGVRYFRDLPLCLSQTNTLPVVPVQSGTIAAGREFLSGPARLRVAKRVVFTALSPIATGTGGATVAGAPAATQTFNAAGGFDWTTIVRPDGTLGAHKGDILVLGFNNAGAKSTDAGTYRVASDPAPGASITVEALNGANFPFAGAANVPWRLHFASDADSAPVLVPGASTPGGYGAADVGGYTIPSRPLTNATGGNTSGAWAAGTQLTPREVPPATTGSSWDVLSGLGGRLMPGGGGGIQFTAAVQGINAPASAGIDALYATAIDALLADADPARSVNILVAARKSAVIRSKLKSHVETASSQGIGRSAVLSPDLGTVLLTTVLGDTDPGVGANRSERVDYAWPGVKMFVPEAVNFRLKTADVNTTIDGILDDSTDFWLASVMSNLPPERNPGQAGPPVPEVMAPVLGMQRGLAPSALGIGEYIQLRDKGVVAVRFDRTAGPIFQSGVTTSLISGQKNINRRRMADFIEDSLAERLVQFSKLPLTAALKDQMVGETVAFLNELLSPNNPPAQRIVDFQVDDKSGNTKELEAKGIFVLIVRVRTLATADFIVLQAEIGEGVLNVSRQQ